MTPQKEQILKEIEKSKILHLVDEECRHWVSKEEIIDFIVNRDKEQEEELVKKIEEYEKQLPNDYWNEIEQGRYQAIEYILNIINHKHE